MKETVSSPIQLWVLRTEVGDGGHAPQTSTTTVRWISRKPTAGLLKEDGDYSEDNVRFFHNVDPANLRFEERALDIGFINVSQGRGIACFDMDRDGKQDIVVSNNAADKRSRLSQ